MKLDAFRKIIREEIKKAIQEEMRDILLEAVKSASKPANSSTPIKQPTQPYSKVEQEMLKQAFKAVGAKYKDLNNGDMRSLELDSTNSKSPVVGFKGFK